MYSFEKGSEWRKWDFHVHTPESVLCNGFPEGWDEYVKLLFKKAVDFNIHAIGITDYFSLDGFKILKNNYLENEQKMKQLFCQEELDRIQNIFVFPNIEFRLNYLIQSQQRNLVRDRRLNYHVLFSNELDIEEIENDFLFQIKTIYDAFTGQITERRPLTNRNLRELGERLINEHPQFSTHEPLYVGMMNAAVNIDDIVQTLNENSRFKDKYLLGLPADEDLSKGKWDSQAHLTRKNYIKQSHFIFSSNSKTISVMLGGDDKDHFVSEFGCLKPCLWGSDAHEESKLFKPDEERFTWVKGNLSFEGLKQVIYDPESRVRIQKHNPQMKSSYQRIQRVRFMDDTMNASFGKKWIEINPDLNSIIGGKSSGKSLLLFHIAKAINAGEVDEKTSLSKSSTYSDLIDQDEYDFEVEWANGEISKLSEQSDSRPIAYIPQLYINHLAEQDGKGQLNTIIKQILMQDERLKKILETSDRDIKETSLEINKDIAQLFTQKDEYEKRKKAKELIGSAFTIQKELKELKDAQNKLRLNSGFTEEEEEEANVLTQRLNDLDERREILVKFHYYVDKIMGKLELEPTSYFSILESEIISDAEFSCNSTFLDGLLHDYSSEMLLAIDRFKQKLNQKELIITQRIKSIDSEIDQVNQKLKPLMEKIEDQKALETITEKLENERGRLKKINEIDLNLSEMIQHLEVLRKEINEKYKILLDQYSGVVSIIELQNSESETLKIAPEVVFLSDKFDEFTRAFDRRGNMHLLLGELVEKNGNYNFLLDKHPSIISEIEQKVWNQNGLPLIRKGVELQDLYTRLFSDCFSIDYRVSHNDEMINHMSPGKRGMVLLKLLFQLSNSNYPILIDQPEDNLDNRTIFSELNTYIRDAKGKRQIIMVTHNANLVVSADSECVIVANQAGQMPSNENEQYRFEYCSGGLELTFSDSSQPGCLKKQGIREHVCQVLEGGVDAFKVRELKYGLKS